jgi:PAS domain S-box-containing protein
MSAKRRETPRPLLHVVGGPGIVGLAGGSPSGEAIPKALRSITPADALALRKSEERYRTLFNSIDEGYCTIEMLFDDSGKPIDYRFLEINPSFEKQTGIQNAVGKLMLEIAPKHETYWFELYGKVAMTGEPVRVENFAAQLDRWFDVNATRVGAPEERTVSVLFSDITERKRAEDALRESEEGYRMILDGVEDYAIFMLDAEGEVVSWNAGAERIEGYTATEIIGQNFACFFPPQEVERGRPAEILRMTIEHGRHEEQSMRVRKDGTQYRASLTWTALRDSAGKLRGFSEFGRDLSDSEELRARYRNLLEASRDAMIVVNRGGSIMLVNASTGARFGYAVEELIGMPVTDLIPDGVADRLPDYDLSADRDAIALQARTDVEVVGRRRDGSEFPIEIMLSPLAIAEGIFMTAVVRDISVRKAAEANLRDKIDELKRSNEELGHFAYIASHDLQEPLRMVASYTQLLSKRYKGKLDADADEFIAFAVDGASRMQRLIEDLLAFSRVATAGSEILDTSSETALELATMNLHEAIKESGALVTHDQLPRVQADETQLVQLFQNLVGNAIKYRSPGVPRVHISAAKQGSRGWSFAVKDNGIGIAPQYLERIFGMFQRLHKRTEFSGTGMGLAICKKIVERHGGTLTVESRPGHGSTFSFVLASTGSRP